MPLEDGAKLVVGDTATSVDDVDAGTVLLEANLNCHAAAHRVLETVADQVEDDLLVDCMGECVSLIRLGKSGRGERRAYVQRCKEEQSQHTSSTG